jgi:hypothetical protein
VFDAEVVDGERCGKDGLVGVPAELVAVVAAGGDLEAADLRATELAEHRDRRTGTKSLIGVEVHVDLPWSGDDSRWRYAAVPLSGTGMVGSMSTSPRSLRRVGSRSSRTSGGSEHNTNLTCAAVAARQA